MQAKDAGGNNRADHAETFVADFSGKHTHTPSHRHRHMCDSFSLTGPGSSSVLSVPHVSGANDGLYRVDYVLTTVGTYTVDVTLGGVAIKDRQALNLPHAHRDLRVSLCQWRLSCRCPPLSLCLSLQLIHPHRLARQRLAPKLRGLWGGTDDLRCRGDTDVLFAAEGRL